jgi:hypothetical protein
MLIVVNTMFWGAVVWIVIRVVRGRE